MQGKDNRLISGGQALAQMLKAFNVGPMFGMGGFQLLPFYDAVRRLGLMHTLINDERCGIFAADAYAKLSGRVGVCDATLGPGATNLVTGLVEALNAGTPLVVLVGNTHRLHSWKNMTQEARQLEILQPACKELIRIEAIERIPELVRRAFAVATSGRPGPVVLDIPEDICHASYAFGVADFQINSQYEHTPALRCRPGRDAMTAAVTLLSKAHKPLILAGGGVHISGAAQDLQNFAEAQRIPVAHTMSGKGAIACTHPLNAGLFGRYERIANSLIEEADCLLVVGCKLGELATQRYALPLSNKPLIHMDIVAEEFGRTVAPEVTLWCDIREGLRDLQQALAVEVHRLSQLRAEYAGSVAQRMIAWRESVWHRLSSDKTPISMARLIHELNQIMPADSVLVADGGFVAHWGGLLYDTKQPGRGFLPDRGFASIGYGLPGAMGAQLAAGNRKVVGLMGDGGFNMVLGELETARRLGLDFVLIVANNAASGYVKALQHLMYGPGSYQSSDLAEMNYASVAKTLGCRGIRIERPEQLADSLASALAESGCPSVLDVAVTRDPSQMLPQMLSTADSRTAQIKPGDRMA